MNMSVERFRQEQFTIIKPRSSMASSFYTKLTYPPRGLVSTLQAATHNWQGEMSLRFLMGVFEAGYGPGIPYLLSFFYLRSELGLRIGYFLSAAPLANTFAGALAYGITSGHPSLAKWRVLFLVEGIPTLAMAPITYFLLPDSPNTARFLNEDERRIATARGIRQVGHAEKRVGSIQFREIGQTLLDPKAWITALMYFSTNVSFSSLPVFLPTILNEMGFTAIDAQGLTAPPFFLSFCITILSTWIADKTQQRGFMVAFLSVIGGVGYIMLAVCESVAARYAGVMLAAAGIFPAIANILPWVLNNQGSDTRRGAGIFLLNTVGQCGPLLGTRLYPTNEGPRFVKGQCVCAAFIFFSAFLALMLRLLLQFENKRLDRQHGTLDEQRPRTSAAAQGPIGEGSKAEGLVGTEQYGPMYRYVL